MVDFTLEALKDEIVNDPEGLGYKNSATPTDWKGDQVIADLINDKLLKVDKTVVNMETIRGAIQFDWYNNLSIDEQEFIRWKTPNGGDLPVTPEMKLELTGRTPAVNGVGGTGADNDSWWAASNDQDAAPAMLALIEVVGGRAEVLWGVGRTISAGNVGAAFNEI